MKKENSEPYRALGARIKYLREQWQQSISEVSGTLEIDENELKAIESGKRLPPIEVLDMLISHFLLTEEQAQDLRTLAEDQREREVSEVINGIEDMLMKQIIMCLPMDNRIVYTDTMQATVNDHGVVLQFLQQGNTNSQPVVVSKVGMSREHAERMIRVIQETIEKHDQSKQTKYLPSPKDK